MTYADQEFIPAEGQEETPNYPTAFGITFTPRVAGIVIAVLGLVGATYLLMNVVQPTWEDYQNLQSSVKDKEAQIQGKQRLQQQIEAKQVELGKAKQQNKQVLSLFTTEKTLNTLLLDLNAIVKARNGRLTIFKPDSVNATAQEDCALNPQVNGKLKCTKFDVELKGDFDQVQSSLRSFERLQTLLLVKNFKEELDDDLGVRIVNGKPIPTIFPKDGKNPITGGTKPDVKATFTLEALSPVTEEDAKQASATQKAKK